ncbi:hypothetical protein BC628DRAFT_1401345 [Trametes gibbosa]|nr:hypothetical protein BC628DRAFT_1401345 [Trametes gibbosa]
MCSVCVSRRVRTGAARGWILWMGRTCFCLDSRNRTKATRASFAPTTTKLCTQTKDVCTMPGVELRDVRTRRRPAVSHVLRAPTDLHKNDPNESCPEHAETRYRHKEWLHDAERQNARRADTTLAGGERFSVRVHEIARRGECTRERAPNCATCARDVGRR